MDDGEIATWFAERLPDEWFTGRLEVESDRDEILVVGRIPATSGAGAGAAEERIARFRAETRDARIQIARAAERRFDRTVSWGARCGPVRRLFTTLSVPAMTRLRFAERAVLDTLIDAGVARSRSDALAWCVRLVGTNEERWLADLRDAFAQVADVRASGPSAPDPD